MKIGMVGLGRMGMNMAKRLIQGGHELIVYDLDPVRVKDMVKEGSGKIIGANSMEDLVDRLPKPKIAWMMVPSGNATEETVNHLSSRMSQGDILIDGGNSYFKDDLRRAAEMKKKGIHYVDAGTSGGVWGFERGYCLMVGADSQVFKTVEPIFKTLAPGESSIPPSKGRKPGPGGIRSTAEQGYLLCGPTGSGHFVKMVHNGIEYGMMQSLAEGFDILKNATTKGLPVNYRFDLNIADISELWRRGSVVSSWLLDLIAISLADNPDLSKFEGHVPDSGEGRWTVQAAIEQSIPAETLATALFTRFRSRQEHNFAEKMLSAMRYEFGGHSENS
jgi:6-phosphogluconate dehydrogenase